MPATLRRRFITFHLDDLTVLNGNPNTAFHLAARTATRPHALDLTRSFTNTLGERLHRLDGCSQRRGGTRDGHSLHEVTACERKLCH